MNLPAPPPRLTLPPPRLLAIGDWLFQFMSGYSWLVIRLIGGVPGAGAEVGFELLFEGLSTTVDEGFGGGNRATDNFGDFLVAEFVLAAEEHGRTLVFRQVGEGFLDFGLQFALQEP